MNDAQSNKSTTLKVAAGVAIFALVWTAVLGWWLPGWARSKIEVAAIEALGTPVSLTEVAIQPWTLTVTLKGLRIGPPKAELLQVPQAQVRLSLESVWRLAPVVRRITLTQPQVWVERQSAQRFNFTSILERLQARPADPQGKPVRYALYNIRIDKGSVRYTDRVLRQEHRIEDLNVGLPFISNLPSFTTVDVHPLLEARVDGSALGVSGHVRPFNDGLRSTVALNWRDVDVAQWAAAAKPFIPPELALLVDQGKLDAALTVTFDERTPPALPKLVVQGKVELADLDARWAAGGVRGRWTTLDVEGLDVAPLERQARIGSVTLSGLRIDAKPESAPSTRPVKVPARMPVTSAQDAPWAWSVGKLHLAASAINVEAPGGAALPAVGPVTLQVDGLDSRAKAAPAKLQLQAADALGGQWTASGALAPAAQQVTLDVSATKLKPAPWLNALSKLVSLPLHLEEGDVALRVQVQARPQSVKVSHGQLQLAGIKARAVSKGVADHIDLAGLDAQGVQAQIEGSALVSASIEALSLKQLDVQATRDAQGRWLMLPEPSRATSDDKASTASGPLIALTELRCTACKVVVDDRTVTPAAHLSLQQTDLSVKGLSNDLTQKIGFDLNGVGQGSGRIQLSGDVRPQPLALNSKIAITGLDLRAAQSYVAPYVNITLVAAKAHANGQLSLESVAASPAMNARYQGRFMLADLRTQDSVTQANFLRWKSLALDGLDAAWKNGAINADLGRIALNDFYGRIIINPDGRLNLADLVKHEGGAPTKSLTTPQPSGAASAPVSTSISAGKATASLSAPAAPRQPAMNLRWQGIKLSKGRVDFTDTFIKPNYSARLTQVEGDISAVASTRPEPATVKIAGAVDDSAPLLITGQLHPLGPRLYTDIQGSAKGIELTRLTPYAARYAGYAIEKGSLSVNVHYKVVDGKLEAENKIFLDQLTFGDKVDSPDATKLPVLLAVSLLKNRRGEIDVNLPISGSLDDPEFSVGGIVWRVIVNLLTKAITAPFSLLAGGGSDELGFVPFDPGMDTLSDAAKQRLDALAAKLDDRPQLKLEATGRADPAKDTEGLRNRHVDRLMRQAKAKATDQTPDSVTIAPDERDQWLAAAYKAADIKKPRNLVGLAKTLPGSEMEALLKVSVTAGPAELALLADQRGNHVKAYLVGKLPPERVLLTASKIGTEGLPDDKGPTTRVQFAVK
ncbi:MAG: DUF748 domain-containing protein [Burkholderiales bacterium]|nr:DUF748 domain-containing protein [Burkholderiales bacterium]